MSIGQRLREEREARGFTQLVVAQLVGGSERTVNDWERDVSSPKASVLAVLAGHGFDVRYVVTGSRDYAPRAPLSPEEETLVGYWRAASREVKNAAMGALLGGSAGKPRAEQVFHGRVGGVFQGDVSGGRVEIHDHRGGYARKKPAKPSGKP